MGTRAWGAAAVLLVAGGAQAKLGKKVPQELFLGEMVYTQDQSELQLISRWRLDRHDQKNDYRGTLGFELGLTDSLELQAELPVQSQFQDGARDTGLGDAEVGLQLMTSKHKPTGPDLAFGVRAELPTAADENARAAAGTLSAIGHTLLTGELHGQLMLEAGVEHPSAGNGVSPRGAAIATLYLAANGWFPILQGEALREDEQWQYAIAPGVIWHPGGNFELGLSTPVRFEPDQTSVGGLFTLIYEFELGGEKS